MKKKKEIDVEVQVDAGEFWDNRYYLAVEIRGKWCRAL